MKARILLCAAATLATAVLAGGGVWLDGKSIAADTRTYRAPRTPDGRPNLNGIWQAVNTGRPPLVSLQVVGQVLHDAAKAGTARPRRSAYCSFTQVVEM